MNIDSIKTGIVIDHIKAGEGMKIYNFLNLDELECSIAIIKNVHSKLMGKKDIIKIDSSINLDLDTIGFISPNATINVIKNGKLTRKDHVDVPKRLVNIIKCKNPRCITTTEQDIDHIFIHSDKRSGEYRCLYCETKAQI